jgi:putative ABC transport system permease protein
MPERGDDGKLARSESVYRFLLFLYPADFRLEYGSDMVDAFRDRWAYERARMRRWVAPRVWLFAIRDLISSSLEERRQQWRARSSRSPTPRVPQRSRKLEPFRDVLRDARHALRGFARNPGFVALAVATAAVGIGANAAIFSVINSVVLRPLPYEEPDRLFFLRETWADGGWGPVSYPNLVDWREQNRVFEDLVAYEWSSTSLQDVGVPVRLRGVRAEAGLFTLLRSQPLMGRTFLPGEDRLGQQAVVVLSETVWQQVFGSDRGLLGQAISLDGEPHTVVGVMPAGFRFPAAGPQADLWLPLRLSANRMANRGSHSLAVVGRLVDGVDLAAARTQMNQIAGRLAQQYPEDQGGGGVWVRPLHEEIVGNIRPLLFVLFGAVGLVLLIACANVGNMLLARAADRGREVALRAALGAGRGRIVRQFLTESLLLAGAGGVLGILLAHVSLDVLVALGGAQIPRSGNIQIDGRVLVFSLLVVMVTGVGFGLVPALLASNTDVQSGLGGTSGRSGASRRRRRFRDTLVVAEFALAFVLLMGAGLLIRTWVRLQHVDPGFSVENVLTMRTSLSAEKYAARAAVDFYRDVLERVETLPGVTAAGWNSRLPLQGYGSSGRFAIAGEPWGAPGTEPYAEWRIISPGYFETIGMPMVRGRDFSKADETNTQPVVIVNEALARRYYPDEDPVGKLIQTPTAPELFLRPTERWMTIVGVVADVREAGLHRPPRPILYFPYRQIEQFDLLPDMSLVARAQVPVAGLAGAMRSAVQAVDPGQPVYDVKTMDQVVSDSLSSRRLVSWLFGSFAAIALVLALVGIYGVVSYLVAQRTSEFGVRVALGATPGNVLREVLGSGMVLVGIGLILGIAGAMGVTRILSGLLFGVTATDIPTFAAAAALLAAVALAACAIPARRAMRVDPVEALRYE